MGKFRTFIITLFIYFLRSVSVCHYRKTIKLFIRKYNPQIDLKVELRKVEYNRRFNLLGYTNSEKYWSILYSNINGITSNDYIPESIYYFEVEPRLNNLIFRLPYSDKNNYNRFQSKNGSYTLPEAICHNINGVNYDKDFRKKDLFELEKLFESGKYIIKPSLDSGGGKNIGIIEYSFDGIYFIENNKNPLKVNRLQDILILYKKDFIIQKYVDQHDYFNKLNSTSVNTMRFMTYRSVVDDKIHIIQRIMKIGQLNYLTDNEWTGSHTIGINSEGKLNDFAVNKFGVKTYSVNGLILTDIPDNPFVEKVDRAAAEIASNIYYSRVLGMDFAINSIGEVVFIEANHSYNGINFFQYNNGPLFGEFTDEILEYCLKTKQEHFVLY